MDKLVFENVWRLRMAALDDKTGAVVWLLDMETQGRFARTTPTSFDYGCTLSAGEAAKLNQYCTPATAVKYGTSIWFEDIVGHVGVPEDVQWPAPPRR
jgi:hypothetical protein